MITSFEVGAVFKIIDQASPALRSILKQVRELGAAVDKARANLASLSAAMPAVGGAIGETRALARAWGRVSTQSAAATRNLNTAATAARAAAVPPVGRGSVPGGVGRGGRHGPGAGGGGGSGFHVSSLSAPIPGGHVRVRGGGNIGMAGAGLLGYGAYEDAQMEDAVFQMIYHTGGQQNAANRSKFRKIIQDSMSESGYGLEAIVEAAKQEARMFQGTSGGGIDVLPEMLRAATIESRLKGESPEESMKALIGLAHMTKEYSPEAIKKLAPAFAFLSTANPGSLGSIEKAAGYAVPLLQSGLDIDPMTTLLLGTALARSGATSTRSGTWVREMMLRAMPGTSMMSKTAFQKHEEALKAFGLVDESGKPTWFTDGKADPLKMLGIAGDKAASIPVEKRAAYERALFGAQGGGGFALLADPAVRQQILALQALLNDPTRKNQYDTFTSAYSAGSPMQQGRQALADFNIAMMNLGSTVLPSVSGALKDFDAGIRYINSLMPGMDKNGKGDDKWRFGTRAIEGGLAGGLVGAGIGAFGGPVGAVGGAVIGGVAGGLYGLVEGLVKSSNDATPAVDRYGREVVITGNSAEQAAPGVAALGAAIRALPGAPGGGVFPGGTSAQPMHFLAPQGGSGGGAKIQVINYVDGRAITGGVIRTVVKDAQTVHGSVYHDGMGGNQRPDSYRI